MPARLSLGGGGSIFQSRCAHDYQLNIPVEWLLPVNCDFLAGNCAAHGTIGSVMFESVGDLR